MRFNDNIYFIIISYCAIILAPRPPLSLLPEHEGRPQAVVSRSREVPQIYKETESEASAKAMETTVSYQIEIFPNTGSVNE